MSAFLIEIFTCFKKREFVFIMYFNLMQVRSISVLKDGGPKVKSEQPDDTHDVFAMVGDQTRHLRNIDDVDAGPEYVIEMNGEWLCWDLFVNMFYS